MTSIEVITSEISAPTAVLKNKLFFRTENGAEVSDKITSILATCMESDVNALDYLIAVQRNQLAVRAAPQNWMPWNYPSQA